MTPERWQRIRPILDRALELHGEERTAFLKERCGEDATLREGIETLLRAEARGGLPLDVPVAEYAGDLVAEIAAPAAVGRRIGRYRLVREIGRGGMGAVYLAERADGHFEQTVALKLVKRGMDSDAILARFLTERQVLATLNHPHIARLYDGGVTEEGQPYFAMEYIEGLPISNYCNERHLSVDARLALFVKVCRAVEHAHSRLIVHRDLKPSNIMVATDGEPRLLDFGLAKVLQDPSGDEPTARTGGRWMTLEYASPEQVKGEAVGTPSDTYQLGLILYELLTGKCAYSVSGLSPTEAERVICEIDPPRPSTVVVSGDGVAPVAPHNLPPARSGGGAAVSVGQMNRQKLRKRLKGDLDTIIVKALHKDPDRGYASAATLANDIERHLDGLPIQARPDTTGYRVRKFVHRHRWGVSVAACVVLLVSGVAAFYTVRLQAERDQARSEAAKSEQVANFLLQIFESGDPHETLGEELTALELLDRGAENAAELEDQPEIQAQMLSVIGSANRAMGEYEKAESLFGRALSLRRNVLGPDHLDIASSMKDVAWVLKDMGDSEPAESFAREALAMQRRLLGDDHLDVAKSLNVLAMLLVDEGDYREAEPLARESLAIRQRLLDEEHEDVITGMNNLALVLHSAGNYAEAESLYRRVVAVDRKQLEAMHPYLANDLHNLAFLLMDKGDYEAAEPIFLESLSITEEVYGSDHPLLATRMRALSQLFQQQDRYEEAELLLRQSLDIDRRFRGERHPSTISDLRNLGVLLYMKGDYETSEQYLREAVAMSREQLGEEHPSIAVSLADLARLLRHKGEDEVAEQHFREALAMQRRLLDEHHIEIAASLVGLSWVLIDQSRAEEAELYAREAFDIRRYNLAASDWRVAETKVVLGSCLTLQSYFEEAEALILGGYHVLKEQRGGTNHYTREALESLVFLYERWSRAEEAAGYRAMLEEVATE